jgi:hypothetical protein
VSNKRATASAEDEGEGCGGELEVAVDDRRARVVLLVTREVCCIQKWVMQCILGRQGSGGTRRRYGVVKRAPEGASTVTSEQREGGSIGNKSEVIASS